MNVDSETTAKTWADLMVSCQGKEGGIVGNRGIRNMAGEPAETTSLAHGILQSEPTTKQYVWE